MKNVKGRVVTDFDWKNITSRIEVAPKELFFALASDLNMVAFFRTDEGEYWKLHYMNNIECLTLYRDESTHNIKKEMEITTIREPKEIQKYKDLLAVYKMVCRYYE